MHAGKVGIEMHVGKVGTVLGTTAEFHDLLIHATNVSSKRRRILVSCRHLQWADHAIIDTAISITKNCIDVLRISLQMQYKSICCIPRHTIDSNHIDTCAQFALVAIMSPCTQCPGAHGRGSG